MRSIVLENGMIRLDFGEHGKIDLPPAVAMLLVASAATQAEIRRAVLTARKQLTLGAKPPAETLTDLRSL